MVVNSNATTMLSTTSLPSSTEELYADDLPSWLHALAFITYVVLFVFAFVVDLAILFVFWRAKELRNITNNLLCNMVAADLLFAFSNSLGRSVHFQGRLGIRGWPLQSPSLCAACILLRRYNKLDHC